MPTRPPQFPVIDELTLDKVNHALRLLAGLATGQQVKTGRVAPASEASRLLATGATSSNPGAAGAGSSNPAANPNQGPAGPAGPQGPAGADGAPGASGASLVYAHSMDVVALVDSQGRWITTSQGYGITVGSMDAVPLDNGEDLITLT